MKELLLNIYMKVPQCMVHLVQESRHVTDAKNFFMSQILPSNLETLQVSHKL